MFVQLHDANLVSGMLEPMLKTFFTLTFIRCSFYCDGPCQHFRNFHGRQTNSSFVSVEEVKNCTFVYVYLTVVNVLFEHTPHFTVWGSYMCKEMVNKRRYCTFTVGLPLEIIIATSNYHLIGFRCLLMR